MRENETCTPLTPWQTIGDNCTLSNTILCRGAVVCADATLKDCRVGIEYVLEATDGV